MKLTAIILLSACLTASAKGFGQTISLSEKNAYLSQVFKKIEKQTDYTFDYTGSQLSQAKRVTIEINNGTLEQVLALCFKDQPFIYAIIEKTIAVKPKIEDPSEQATSEPLLSIDIKVRVVNEKGEPLEEVTVTVKGTKNATATDVNGIFELKGIDESVLPVKLREVSGENRGIGFFDFAVLTVAICLMLLRVMRHASKGSKFSLKMSRNINVFNLGGTHYEIDGKKDHK